MTATRETASTATIQDSPFHSQAGLFYTLGHSPFVAHLNDKTQQSAPFNSRDMGAHMATLLYQLREEK